MSEIQTTSWRQVSGEESRHCQYQDEQGSVSLIAINEYRFAETEIFYATSRQEREVKMKELQDSPMFNMYFSLEGCCSAYHTKRETHYPIKNRQHTVTYTPQFEGYYSIESPLVRNFGISLSQAFFHRLYINDLECLKRFWDKIHAGKHADMTPEAMPITFGQLSVIQDIQQCTYSGLMKQLFYESKIVELFLLQAEQSEKLNGIKSDPIVSRDIDKLYAARNFVQEHMFEPFTLLQVARSCGLNDFKLKKGFKELFGTTVFGYLNELKMNHGRQLLLDTSCTVYEAAYMLGYTDPYNFSKSFKKHFGYLPGKLKNTRF